MILKKYWSSLDNNLQLFWLFNILWHNKIPKYIIVLEIFNQSFGLILYLWQNIRYWVFKIPASLSKNSLLAFLLSIPVLDTIASPSDGHNYFVNVANKFSFYLTTIRWRKTRSFRDIIATYFYVNAISWFISH